MSTTPTPEAPSIVLPGAVDPKGDCRFLKCDEDGRVATVHQEQLNRIEDKLDWIIAQAEFDVLKPDSRWKAEVQAEHDAKFPPKS